MHLKAGKFTTSAKPIVPRGFNTAGLSIKTGYFLLVAMALVFVVMLVLTVCIPGGVLHRRPGDRIKALSALGQKQTSHRLRVMSALPPKADIAGRQLDVRFVPKADILHCSNNAGLLGQALPNFRQQFSFDTYFSAGLRKNPQRE